MHKDASDLQNETKTCVATSTKSTQPRSGPVLYELVSYRGEIFGPYTSAQEAGEVAAIRWPDQEQDEDRTGKGWDVQIAGLKL